MVEKEGSLRLEMETTIVQDLEMRAAAVISSLYIGHQINLKMMIIRWGHGSIISLHHLSCSHLVTNKSRHLSLTLSRVLQSNGKSQRILLLLESRVSKV